MSGGRSSTARWYDPLAVKRVRFRREADYVEGAGHLLSEAVAKALKMARAPAIALSGGLDSSIVADEVLRQLPPPAHLRSFTAIPCDAWDGRAGSSQYGDEQPFVARFAEMHPRLVPTYLKRDDGAFDEWHRETMAATGMSTRHIANGAFFHAVFREARKAGCDWVFDAELGNLSYSNDARWSYVEYFLRGRWGQLQRVLAARAGDTRPMWRKIAALSVLPLLPRPIQERVRDWANPGVGDPHSLLSLMRPSAAKRLGVFERMGAAGRRPIAYHRSREEMIRFFYDDCEYEGPDAWRVFEQVHGIRRRDVTAYRPLIEYCLGLPTDQFVRDGEDRRLARRLAIGRLPEEQRTIAFTAATTQTGSPACHVAVLSSGPKRSACATIL